MGKDQLPGFDEKRRLLYSTEVRVEETNAAADRLLASEYYDDALDLYEKVQNLEKVRTVCQVAFAAGDVGLWMKCRRILKEPIGPEEWQKIGEIALMADKQRFALFAYQRAGDEAKVEQLRQTLLSKPPPEGDSRTG